MGALVGAPRDVLVPRGDLGMLVEPPGLAAGWEKRELGLQLERGWEMGSGGFAASQSPASSAWVPAAQVRPQHPLASSAGALIAPPPWPCPLGGCSLAPGAGREARCPEQPPLPIPRPGTHPTQS